MEAGACPVAVLCALYNNNNIHTLCLSFNFYEGWRYSKGFIDENMVREHMPKFDKDVQVLLCGPPPMIKFACVPNLEKQGFTEKHYFAF